MVGVRGSGKTTLIRSVLPRVGRFEYISTDTVIRSLVGTQYPQFNNFPDEVKKQIRSRAVMYMRDETERFRCQLIVEDHATLYNPNTRKIERVIPEEASFFFSDMILHSVEPRLVLQRRRSDPLVRRTLDLEFIKREVLMEEDMARNYTDIAHMDFHVINDDGGPGAAEQLFRILSGYT
jgi:adenylate kinase